MTTKELYESLCKVIDNLTREEILTSFNCHNITKYCADLNIGKMCITINFRDDFNYICDNIELWDNNNCELINNPFDFSKFNYKELTFADYIIGRINQYQEEDLVNHFKFFTNTEFRDFLIYAVYDNHKTLDDDFASIIDDWIDIKPY